MKVVIEHQGFYGEIVNTVDGQMVATGSIPTGGDWKSKEYKEFATLMKRTLATVNMVLKPKIARAVIK